MDIKINSFNKNLAFCARRGGYTQSQMLQVMPDLIVKNTSLEHMAEITGRAPSAILKWVKEYTGKTLKSFLIQADKKAIGEKMVQYINENKSIEEIAKLIGKSETWTRNCLQELGLLLPRETLNKKLEEECPKLIEQGFTIEKMSKILNISGNKIRVWIKNKYGDGIIKIRQKNDIKIKRDENPEIMRLKDELEEYFSKDMTLSEISRITGRPISRIAYWMNKFGFTTKNQQSHKMMREITYKMIKDDVKLYDIAKTVGLSNATISRWIKKTYGKTYTDIRFGR